MPRKIFLRLTQEDRRLLTTTARKDTNWRVRERAQTVLYFDENRSAKEVAALMGLHVRTVSSTRTGWLALGMESLRDLPRVGAPQKLAPHQSDQLVEWARQQPRSLKELQIRLEREGGPQVHLNTIRATLKKAEQVRNPTPHPLKKTNRSDAMGGDRTADDKPD